MLNFFKKEKTIASVVDGDIISITNVPDQVFSQKILGDGFAVIPTSGNIVSPVCGTVSDVSDTLHAYCITSDDGLEILVHIGIDTVELKGNGFTAFVKKGDRLEKGSPIAKADLDTISSSGYNTTVMVVITNTNTMKSFNISEGSNQKAGSDALSYKL